MCVSVEWGCEVSLCTCVYGGDYASPYLLPTPQLLPALAALPLGSLVLLHWAQSSMTSSICCFGSFSGTWGIPFCYVIPGSELLGLLTAVTSLQAVEPEWG